jgi:hypothetical protein
MIHGLMVYLLNKFCVTGLINEPDCLTDARLNHPTIRLQLSGDPAYDQLKKRLGRGRGKSLIPDSLLYAGQRASQALGYVWGGGASAPQNIQPLLQEDIQFLNSLQSVANGPDNQSIVDEIKQVAAEILDRRVGRTINTCVHTLESRIKSLAEMELDQRIRESDNRKIHDAWDTLRIKLTDELEKLNSVPSIPYDTLQSPHVPNSFARTVLHLTNIWPTNDRDRQ